MKITGSILRLRARGGAFAHDLAVVPIAWLGAFWLQFDFGSIPAHFFDQALRLLPVVVIVQGSVLVYFGLHRGVWRFASLPDLVRILKAVVVGTSLCVSAAFLVTRLTYVPRPAFVLFALLLVFLLSAPRLTYRWWKDRHTDFTPLKAALVVGAGRAGETLVRSLLRDPSNGYRPVGFVDDDPEKKGRDVRGIRVLGYCRQVARIAADTGAEVIAIAMPSASAAQLRRIVEFCEGTDLPIRMISNTRGFADNHAAPGALREVVIEDLLDRGPAQLDWPMLRSELTGRTILVTGGGGSIGSELCRQLARLDPARLVIVDVSEFNLYQAGLALGDAYPDLVFSAVIADVCDPAAMNRIFERHAPDIVFHAAAYKQVPILEEHLREAVRVNTLGTRTVADAASAHGAGLFVLVSSDKAVNPTNAMGASKRLAEMVCLADGGTSPVTRFISVRFGNVLDSAGSVVPLFREQIERGGPVTVTHPEMQRYFMTIPEACQLLMAAAALGKGGEIFVLDMGEPMRILYLAERMIQLAGKRPHQDVAIKLIGPRPGEKLSEELFGSGETYDSTAQDKILLAKSRPVRLAELADGLKALREACDVFDESALKRIVSGFLPGYAGQPSAAGAAPSHGPRPAGGGGRAAPPGEESEQAGRNVVPIGRPAP